MGLQRCQYSLRCAGGNRYRNYVCVQGRCRFTARSKKLIGNPKEPKARWRARARCSELGSLRNNKRLQHCANICYITVTVSCQLVLEVECCPLTHFLAISQSRSHAVIHRLTLKINNKTAKCPCKYSAAGFQRLATCLTLPLMRSCQNEQNNL